MLGRKSHAVQQRFNAASVLCGGRVVATYCKRELPNYQVFDERRYFASGRDAGAGRGGVRGRRRCAFGLLICEDAWFDEPARSAKAAGAQVLCVLNASPFHLGKAGEREARMAERARAVGMPLLYAHLVGAQDEVVFDGASFAVDAQGVVARPGADASKRRCCCSRWPRVGRWRVRSQPLPALEAQAWARAGHRRARLRRQERLSRRDHRPVGRHRLGAGAGRGGRRAGRRPGARGDDAFALHRRHLLDRRARHGAAPGRALRRDLDRADVRGLPRQPGRASSPACPRTRPRRTSRRASAARC